MKSYVTSGAQPSSGGSFKYQLFGVSNHIGSLNGDNATWSSSRAIPSARYCDELCALAAARPLIIYPRVWQVAIIQRTVATLGTDCGICSMMNG